MSDFLFKVCNFIKKRLQNSCFPVNFVKPFNTSGWLHLRKTSLSIIIIVFFSGASLIVCWSKSFTSTARTINFYGYIVEHRSCMIIYTDLSILTKEMCPALVFQQIQLFRGYIKLMNKWCKCHHNQENTFNKNLKQFLYLLNMHWIQFCLQQ